MNCAGDVINEGVRKEARWEEAALIRDEREVVNDSEERFRKDAVRGGCSRDEGVTKSELVLAEFEKLSVLERFGGGSREL